MQGRYSTSFYGTTSMALLLLISGSFLFICLVACKASAQLLTSNNAAISLTGNIQLTVKGDVLNQSSASISNNGVMDFTGNWINNAGNNCFGTSTGTVILNGGNQSIGGTSTTAFNNVLLQGSGIKTLLVNTLAGGAVALPSGMLDIGNVVLDLNSHILQLTNPATGAVTSTSGYILSEDADNSSIVEWAINTITGSHVIPFGNSAGVQLPFTFELVSGNAGIVSVSTYATAPDNTPFPVTPVAVTNIQHVSGSNNSANVVDRFWQVGPSGTPVASLTFSYAVIEEAASGNTGMRAQRWDGPVIGWEQPPAGQTNPTAHSVLVNNVNAFGPWTLSLLASPLPVELLIFDARLTNENQVDLTWQTASEINNDYFTIERTTDLVHFEQVAIVDGAGSSTVTHRYRSRDPKPYMGISYYRLKQTDFDGRYAYAEVRPILLNQNNSSGFSIYPNPASSYFYIHFDGESAGVHFNVFDVNGKRVLETGTSDLDVNGLYKINTDNLESGIYFIVSSNGQRQKLILTGNK